MPAGAVFESYADPSGNTRFSASTAERLNPSTNSIVSYQNITESIYDLWGLMTDWIGQEPDTGQHNAAKTTITRDITGAAATTADLGTGTGSGQTSPYNDTNDPDYVPHPVTISNANEADNYGQVWSGTTTAGSDSTSFSQVFNVFGEMTSYTDPDGRTTTYTRDDAGRVTVVTLPDSTTIQNFYNGFGDLYKTIDPDGQITIFTFDAAGRQTGSYQESPTGDRFEAVLDNTDATLSADGYATWSTVADEGYDGGYRYLDMADANDPSQISASWSVTTPDYVDSQSNICGEEVKYQILATWPADALNASTVDFKVYDGTTLLETFTVDQTDFEVQGIFDGYSWQSLGLVTLDVDQADGSVPDLTIKIEPATLTGRIVCDGLAVIEAVPSTQTIKGPAGETLLTIDGLGRSTRYQYDQYLRVTKVTDAEGGETSYTYTTYGQLESVTDPEGNITEYSYNSYGQMTTETVTIDSVDYVTEYTYGSDGSLLYKEDRDGRVTAYYTDNLGRQVLERSYDSASDFTSVATPARERETTFDIRSRPISISEGDVTRRYGYDNLGRMTSYTDLVTGMPEVVYTSTWSDSGQLTGLSASIDGVDDFINTYVYNSRSQLEEFTQTGQTGGNVVADKYFTFGYDDAGRQEEINRYASTDTSELVVTSTFTYDPFGRLTALDHEQGTTSLAAYTWSYDAAGQLLEQTSPDGDVVYSYDLTGQVTGADWDVSAPFVDESYDYDLSGNRTEVTNIDGTDVSYTTGDRNQTTSDGTYQYSYNAQGQRTQKFIWTDTDQDEEIDENEKSSITDYTWDALGHLIHVETPDDAVDYIYNFEGLRVAKHVDSDKDDTIDYSEYFSYGPVGNDILLDFVDSDGEGTTESAELSHRYAWNPAAVDQLLAQEDIDVAVQDTDSDGVLELPGDVKYPLADHLLSNRDWAGYDDSTDTTSITTHVVIDTFGNIDVSESTGEGLGVSRYLYTSQEYEGETDLHYYDARWYDPRVAKFLSEDPIGFESGDVNLSRYVENVATTFIDPGGLDYIDTVTRLNFRSATFDTDVYWVAEHDNPWWEGDSFRFRFKIGTKSGDQVILDDEFRGNGSGKISMEALETAAGDFWDVCPYSPYANLFTIQHEVKSVCAKLQQGKKLKGIDYHGPVLEFFVQYYKTAVSGEQFDSAQGYMETLIDGMVPFVDLDPNRAPVFGNWKAKSIGRGVGAATANLNNLAMAGYGVWDMGRGLGNILAGLTSQPSLQLAGVGRQIAQPVAWAAEGGLIIQGGGLTTWGMVNHFDEDGANGGDNGGAGRGHNAPGGQTTPGGKKLTNHAAQDLWGKHGFRPPFGEVDDIIAQAQWTTQQADGAIVHIHKVAGRGRKYRIVIEGAEGIVTAIKNLTPHELQNLAKNYGFQLPW